MDAGFRVESRDDHRPRGGANAPAEIEPSERRRCAIGREARDNQVGRRHDEPESDAGDPDRQRAGDAPTNREAGEAGCHQPVPRGQRRAAADARHDQARQGARHDASRELDREERTRCGVRQRPARRQPRQHRAEDSRDESSDDEAGEEQRPAAQMRIARFAHGREMPTKRWSVWPDIRSIINVR